MFICNNCGTQLLPNSKICTQCGTPVTTTPGQTTPSTPSSAGTPPVGNVYPPPPNYQNQPSSQSSNPGGPTPGYQNQSPYQGTTAGGQSPNYQNQPPYQSSAGGQPPYGQTPGGQYGQPNYGQSPYGAPPLPPPPPKKGISKIILILCGIIVLAVLAFALLPKAQPDTPPTKGGGTIGTGAPPQQPPGGNSPPQQPPQQNPPPQQGGNNSIEFKTINAVIQSSDLIPLAQTNNVAYMLVRSSVKTLNNGTPYAWILTANVQQKRWMLGEIAFDKQQPVAFLGSSIEKDATTGQETKREINQQIKIEPNSPYAVARQQVLALVK